MIIEVCGSVARMITKWTYEGFLCTVNCYMILECFCLVGFIITMSTVELENASMRIFTG